jgi:hypothetical protein
LKKDIHIPKVEGVGIAIAKEVIEGDTCYRAHIVNFNKHPLENVLISSRGYGMVGKEQKATSKFNHFVGDLEAESSKAFETVSEEVFGLSNEFFVTYYIGRVIYDKKYVFVAETILEENLIEIKILELEGVLIR